MGCASRDQEQEALDPFREPDAEELEAEALEVEAFEIEEPVAQAPVAEELEADDATLARTLCLGWRPRAKNVRTEMAMQQKPAHRQNKQHAVEEIVDSRYGVDGSIEYHVRWADYGPEHNTWQGWGTLQGVEWMLDAFDDLQQPP